MDKPIPWPYRTERSYPVRASCPTCKADLALVEGKWPKGACEPCGYSVDLCGNAYGHFKICVREEGHIGIHLSPSGTGWGTNWDEEKYEPECICEPADAGGSPGGWDPNCPEHGGAQ